MPHAQERSRDPLGGDVGKLALQTPGSEKLPERTLSLLRETQKHSHAAFCEGPPKSLFHFHREQELIA